MIEGLDAVVAAAREAASDVDRAARFPREAVAALSDTGLLGLTLPTANGGLGLTAADFAEVTSTLAEACASSAMIFTMHVSAVQALRAGGAGGRFDAVLRSAAEGQHLATLALSERATRSNFWLSMGHSEPAPGGRRLDVHKSFVTSAGPADGYVVSVPSPDGGGPDALDLYYVEAADGGIDILDWWQGAGLRGNASAPVRFRTTVADSAAIGPPGGGQALLFDDVVPWFQLGAACTSVGIARAAAASTLTHVSTTVLEHLGQSLGQQPVVRHGLGQLHTDVDVVSGFVRQVAVEMASGAAARRHVLEVKVAANEAALRATDLAMRLCGGAAYSGRHPLDRHFRDARAGIVMAPTADMLYDMVGRTLMGEPPI
jgi:alkylation response protein AidB-like acyl-CoA dehydrogenase